MGLLLCISVGMYVQAAQWKKTSKGDRYLISKGNYAKNGWKTIKGKKYYFDKDGYLQKGWLKVGGNLYFLDKKTGECMISRWVRVGGNYYYADKNGVIQKKKWIKTYYYVKPDGKRAKGWLTISGRKYYFDKNTGKRVSGWKKIDSKYYCFDSKGCMVVNKWVKKNGKPCYLRQDGVMATSTWIGKYQVGADGARTGKTRTPGLKKENNKYYFYDNSFQRVKGWRKVENNTYYFGSNYAAVTGFQNIGGKNYYFSKNGKMVTGLQTIDGAVYYFETDGVMASGKTVTVSGIPYTLDENGKWIGKERGETIAAYAKKFLGNPYVYGGISLTDGADCSGFTYSVMKRFGILIPRVADDQRKGKDPWGVYTKSAAVKPDLANLTAGDLVFYGKPSHHVALYIGDGKVIHAADESTGIIISNYNYSKPSAARRYW